MRSLSLLIAAALAAPGRAAAPAAAPALDRPDAPAAAIDPAPAPTAPATKVVPDGVLPPDVASYAGDPLVVPPSDQVGLDGWWDALGQWRIRDAAYYVSGRTVKEGPCTINLNTGILVPIYNGKGAAPERVVGMAFIGDGTLEVDFPRQVDRLTFANQQVMKAGADAASLTPIVHGGQPFTTKISRGLLLSADPSIVDLLKGLDPVGGGFRYVDTPDGIIAEYVVVDDKGRLKARVLASEMLPSRRTQLINGGWDPVAMLRLDRFLNEVAGVPGEELGFVGDFQTDTRYGAVNPGKNRGAGANDQDRWLTCFRDGSGRHDTGGRTTVFSHGTDSEDVYHNQRFATERFPMGHASLDQATRRAQDTRQSASQRPRMQATRADVEVKVRPVRRSLELQAEVESKLIMRARGGEVRHVALRLPRDEAITGTFKIDSLTLADGTPVPWVTLTTQAEDDARETASGKLADRTSAAGGADPLLGQDITRLSGSRTELLAVLPRAVAADDEVELHLNWQAVWPYGSWARWKTGGDSTSGLSTDSFNSKGVATGFRQFLPTLLDEPNGTRWTFTARVGVPLLRKIGATVSGDTTNEREDEAGNLYWTETRGAGVRSPGVAIGRWSEAEDPPSMGFPGVKVHLLDSDSNTLAGFPAEVRRVLAYLDRFLPAFVGDELEVYQSPSVLEPELRAGHDGVIEIMTIQVSNDVGTRSEVELLYPHLAQQLVARQLAWQYWGERVPPADAGQRWIAHGLSDTYASFYVRGVYGRQGWLDQLDRSRKTLEHPEKRTDWPVEWHDEQHFLSLTNGGSFNAAEGEVLRRYGQYVTSWMLRKKVGDQAFFRTLDRMAEDRNVRGLDTDRFRRWLEWESDMSLQAWFDYWVEGGFAPNLEVEVRLKPAGDGLDVTGCIASDVPFGHLELPIRVADQRSPEDLRKRAERELAKAQEAAEKARRVAASSDGGRDPVEAAVGRMDAAMVAASATDGRWIEGLVDVIDGYGEFTVPGRALDADVRIDPEGLIIAYSRKLVSVAADAPPTACEVEVARRRAQQPATTGEGG